MEQRKRLVRKIALGLAAILLAAGITTVIKDLLAMQNPTSALPDMVVRYDVSSPEPIVLPEKHVMRVAYAWRFLNNVKEDEVPPSEWENMEYGWMVRNVEMDFSFSYDCRYVKVSVAKVKDSFMPPVEDDFVPMQLVDTLIVTPEENEYYITADNHFLAPMNPGLYVYRVEADWGFRGSVLYYFKISVPEV